ncbi:MAG: DUF433 domain-containing protein [Acidobacteriota bacterium]
MAFVVEAEVVPLEMSTDGVMLVGGTRVTLDTILAAFAEGATAEEIVQQYPTLRLADVYSVIGYCLRREAEILSYLERRQQQSQEVRKKNELRFDPHGVRDRLLARRKE